MSNWLTLILFITSREIYSILKELKYTAVLLTINETQCVVLLLMSLRFMTHAQSFDFDELLPEKTPLNLGS